ncbi:MAG: glycosyltransferase, partial [Methylomonas sp.]
MSETDFFSNVGVVVIGRNEGERLRRCLASIAGQSALSVYVDSGSSDDSIQIAETSGVAVINLDLALPFTAARARNAGLNYLQSQNPHLAYVQFVDGDCEVAADWLKKAAAFLGQHEQVGVVCGRRRERYPDRSIYNRLCDIEWDTPIGEAKACGGDALMRMAAIYPLGGYRDDLIAGEEPELCVRIRAAGWKVWRIHAEMTLHDAAMQRFSQWWRRTLRSGYAYAEGCYLHGFTPEKHFFRESARALVWGLAIPAVILGLSIFFSAWFLGFFAVYPAQILRLALNNDHPGPCWLWPVFMVLGKFPEAAGEIKFLVTRILGKGGRLIE